MKSKTAFILFVFASGMLLSACGSSRMTKQQKQAIKVEKQMKKENEQAVEDYLKHHYDIQPLATQKMMKSSKKRAKKINKRQKNSFVDRVFRRKRSKGCNGN